MRECTREQVIEDLRQALIDLAGDEHSICHVAKEKGLFCGGFAQWKLHELKQQYPQITRSRPHLSRAELEDLADRWQMARQLVTGEKLACDVQVDEKVFQTCKGWDEFTDEELAKFHHDLCDQEVLIVSGAT